MDRRVFQPRPNGNDVRRRNAIGMAAIVLLAVWLWSMSQKNPPPPVTGSPPASTPAPRPAKGGRGQ